jgi:hypothetical protein
MVRREDQRLDRLARDRIAERRPAGKLRKLAQESARAEREEVLAPAKRVVAVDVDLSAQQDGKPDADLADRRQRLAGVKAAQLAEAPRALDGGLSLVPTRWMPRSLAVDRA